MVFKPFVHLLGNITCTQLNSTDWYYEQNIYVSVLLTRLWQRGYILKQTNMEKGLCYILTYSNSIQMKFKPRAMSRKAIKYFCVVEMDTVM